MAEIIVENGPQEGTRVTLSRQAACTIGADQGCDLQLTGPGIAGRHAMVKALKDDGYGMKGLDAPVTIGGHNIAAARLRDGDVLELGSVRLRYLENGAAAATEQQMLGGFRLIEEIGRGGMGTVYRAEQVSLHREVALKVLSKDLTEDPVFVARFVAEARAAARLHHPNVVQVFDVGHDGDTYYYSMELMLEGSLERRLKSKGRLTVDEALPTMIDAARGLAFAESLKIVHRDIKPDNLMIDQHGTIKIADLGLALSDEEDSSKIVGTPHFMSPEQALRKPLDHRSDLYSLGCTFYRLVTGRTPFRGNTSIEILRAHLKEPLESPRQVNSEISAEAAAVIERLLEKDPDQRYQSADDLLGDMEALQAPPSRKGLLIGAIVAAVVVAGGALWWGLTRENTTTVKTEVITQTDPDTDRLRAEQAKTAARAAYYEVKSRTLEGGALATALEKMAQAHPGTEWAEKAKTEADQVRAAVAATQTARRAHNEAVEAAVGKLRLQVTALRDAGRLRDALAALNSDALPETLRADPVVVSAIDELRGSLRDRASGEISALEAAVEAAKAARDPAAIDAALDRLASVLDPQSGWPAGVLADPETLRAYASTTRASAETLRAELAAAATAAAWSDYANACFADQGILPAIAQFAFGEAAARATTGAATVTDTGVRAQLAHLAAAASAADRFLTAFATAAATKTLPYRGADAEPDAVIAGFAATGDEPGLTVEFGPRTRPKTRVVPLAQLRATPAAIFAMPDASGDERAAFMALLEISSHVEGAGRLFALVSPDDDTSGTGDQAYPLAPDLLEVTSTLLAKSTEPWAAWLRDEVDATVSLGRALTAFSHSRYGTAAGRLDRLARDAPHSLVALRFH